MSNTVDDIFTRQAAIGGRQEVDLAKLASERAQDRGVPMVMHHLEMARSLQMQLAQGGATARGGAHASPAATAGGRPIRRADIRSDLRGALHAVLLKVR